MDIREISEELEEKNLSEYAALSSKTLGRIRKYIKCTIRTEYQRDRDKIIHSKSFRRLKHKTQVFISPESDHYRTRLTHTLEVSQIARTISRALRLNEDLTEAIALGHDLGHTPFGHAGEKALDNIHTLGFKHNEQSLRIVELLEGNGGLNLTYEVRNGILNHTGDEDPITLEGKIVKISDRIAYINHDIDDALRGKILNIKDIPETFLKTLGYTHKQRINTMIVDIITNSSGVNNILMSKKIKNAMDELRNFMFERVYVGSEAKFEEKKAQNVITQLYTYFNQNPSNIPTHNDEKLNNTDTDRLVCDYIAGMTDRYAINTYKQVFIPSTWRL